MDAKKKRKILKVRKRGFGIMETILALSIAIGMVTGGIVYYQSADRAQVTHDIYSSFHFVRSIVESEISQGRVIEIGDFNKVFDIPALPGFDKNANGSFSHRWGDAVILRHLGNNVVQFSISSVESRNCRSIVTQARNDYRTLGYRSYSFVDGQVFISGESQEDFDAMLAACRDNTWVDVGWIYGQAPETVVSTSGFTPVGYTPESTPEDPPTVPYIPTTPVTDPGTTAPYNPGTTTPSDPATTTGNGRSPCNGPGNGNGNGPAWGYWENGPGSTCIKNETTGGTTTDPTVPVTAPGNGNGNGTTTGGTTTDPTAPGNGNGNGNGTTTGGTTTDPTAPGNGTTTGGTGTTGGNDIVFPPELLPPTLAMSPYWPNPVVTGQFAVTQNSTFSTSGTGSPVALNKSNKLAASGTFGKTSYLRFTPPTCGAKAKVYLELENGMRYVIDITRPAWDASMGAKPSDC
ncbi:hypothetical protein [Defluviimonas salinarum]|uniref:Prepilin-type N-terminal cleavage/methylation domain-containing protein n=1 Tax=Defluviimonas salinarum TaxID=2992147 RepID=A0ABT3J8A6_9RHOB|nr:hypothetical protein [Defluviimonas salinarum]MCW3783918.1 hypothetical protein [Defluviimonas salinarum]